MPIQVLPPQLANQIAAGEVVERPASVVKELVENSLDAGATRIDIDIERGGAKLIRIRDNGCGIKKDELALALARHATSKIASLDDLEAIISLGFRGEALASISSVSRLTLTSRTAEQQEAWQAYAEGRDMDVTVKPAAHPVGTTLEVLDLFYNTPARRKFLRTEKTEFNHIDEIIRRIALARFDVTINLSHNGKIVRQYRAVPEGGQKERRLGAICGTAFLEQALAIEWQHGDLTLRGWVADPNHTTPALAEIQYCYVNGRMMRDRLINHAIRQACEDKLGADQQPAFVLYLEIDPHQVDVNVHPAKHEVRFHQSRLVHDFIYQGVLSVLQQQLETPLPSADPEVRARIEQQAAEQGWESLHRQLQEVDPVAAARIHPNDPQRLSRALEVFFISGKTLTELTQTSGDALPYQVHQFAIAPASRELLHQRIEQRFHQMLASGFEAEVRALFARGDLHTDLPSIRCVGYRQMWSYLEGEISYDEMVYRGVCATRQLAKRQITWLRGWEGVHWLDSEKPEQARDEVLQVVGAIAG